MELITLPPKKDLFFFFKKMNPFNYIETMEAPVPQISSEREEINNKIDFFIKLNDKKSLMIFIEEGVQFSQKQVFNIITKEQHQFLWGKSQFSYDEKKNFFKINHKHMRDIVKSYLLELTKVFNHPNKIFIRKSSTTVTPEIKDFFANARVVGHWIKLYSNDFYKEENKLEIQEHYLLAEQLNDTISKLKIKSLSDVTLIRDSVKDDYLVAFQALYTKSISEDTRALARKAKALDSMSLKEIMTHDINDLVEKFQPYMLPSEAQKLFKDIIDTFESIELNKAVLDMQDITHLDNIKNKRFPQIIQEYITIPEKYRKILAEKAENPDTLLIDSLKEIQKNISPFVDKFNSHQVTQMKKSNAYLKLINK